MDKLEQYRNFIVKILTETGSRKPYFSEIEKQMVFDRERDHYQIVNNGWRNGERIYGCSIHIDLKNDEIWIQQNMTETDLTQKLIERGVPKSDIVLGLVAPELRQYADFAAA